jgi:hypothetical protein
MQKLRKNKENRKKKRKKKGKNREGPRGNVSAQPRLKSTAHLERSQIGTSSSSFPG